MKKIISTLLLLSMSVVGVRAQYGITVLNPDAISMSMGGVVTTNLSGAHTVFNNASLAPFCRAPFQLAVTYYGQDGGDYYAASGYYQFANRNALEIGWRMYVPDEEWNQPDFVEGGFRVAPSYYGSGRSMTFDVGYAQMAGERLSLGITGRYLHYAKDENSASANALALDLSASYRLPLDRLSENSSLLFGAKLANLGAFLDKGQLPTSSLPVNLKVGAALDWWLRDSHKLTFAADYGYCFTPDFVRGSECSVGAEYDFMQLLQLRGGYHFGNRSLYCPDYASVGAGLHFMHIRLDLTYVFAGSETLLHNAYSIGFGLDF